MKKFFILFLICSIMMPFAFGASYSPTVKSLYNFEPKIEFDILEQKYTSINLDEIDVFKILKDFDAEKDWDSYHLDDALILYLREKLEKVNIKFMVPYGTTANVYGIFISEINVITVLQGEVQNDGSVTFNLTDMMPINTLMYVVSDDKV